MPRSKKRRQTRKNSAFSPIVLAAIGGVVLVLAGFVLLMNNNRPAPPPAPEITDYHDEQGIPYPDVPRIPAAEAKTRYDAGTALFVDVRSQGEYDTAHVANAISLPLADLESRYRELPQDAEIITYCT